MSRLLLPILTLWMSTASAVNAQEFEITPFAGWRASDSLEEVNTGTTIKLDETRSYGLLLSLKQDPDVSYDFLFSRQNTQLQPDSPTGSTESLRLDYYQIGGTVFYDYAKLQPFATGGLGVTHISPANDAFSSETRFSLSLGGGLKIPLTQNLGLRFEARGYGTVDGSSGAILCSGGCIVKFNGSLFLQFEASAGLSVAF